MPGSTGMVGGDDTVALKNAPAAATLENPHPSGSATTCTTKKASLKDPPAATSLKDPPPNTIHDKNGNRSANLANNILITEEVEPFKALQHGGAVLDVYAYHRGREGRELRDETTGELLCGDVEPSDTNHHPGDKEPKSMTTSVTIKFPLENENDLDAEMESLQQSGSFDDANSNKRMRYYRDVLQWNLADPATPNPMTFAAGIAEDFGLTYTQMMDLVESIQRQLNAFIHEQCMYAPALVLRPHQEKPPPLAPNLYFDVNGTGLQGGTYHLPAAPKLKPAPPGLLQRTESCASTGKASSVTGNTKNGKKAGAQKRKRSSETIRKVEEIFYQQVRSRLRDVSARTVQEKAEARVEADDESSFESVQTNELNLVENHVCHLCEIEQEVCGVFGCGDTSHAFCFNHLGEQLGLVDTTQLKLDYCPICSLQCTCNDCSTKLEVAAVEFKKRCSAQSATPGNTAFDDLAEFCDKIDLVALAEKKKAAAAAAAAIAEASAKKARDFVERRPPVPKLPRTEFPREVSNGVDMDFGFHDDYNTRFTDKGSFLVTSKEDQDEQGNSAAASAHGSSSSTPSEPVEDGSVDYCAICQKVGNLLCCDFCPRAFHAECFSQKTEDGGTWECPNCRREKEGLVDDLVTGSSELQRICDAYPSQLTTKEDLLNLRLLSILREMLQKLMVYDFGYMFDAPVDVEQIPSYSAIIKKPMDLGTISSNMLNGHYKRELGDAFSLEKLILAVLKDIELVWHNCYMFNIEGSAVYRMAEVQSRRAQSTRQKSFDDLLGEHIKAELEKYKSELKQEREEYRQLVQPLSQRRPSPTTPSQVRHKFAATYPNKGQPVAIFDQDTERIVKVYTSVPSASTALTFIMKLKKQKCEYRVKEVDTRDKLRKILADCRIDPAVRLFGYRWFYLDDLRNRSVVFPSENGDSSPNQELKKHSVVQMVDGELSFFFNSVEEALSFPDLETDIPAVRESLLALKPESGNTEICGRMWRIVGSEAVGSTRNDAGVAACQPSIAAEGVVLLSDVAFVKEDAVSGGRSLTGFQSVAAAFEDWRRAIDSSMCPYRGPKTMDIFQSYYLDNERNVDGIRWRSIAAKTEPSAASASVENAVVEKAKSESISVAAKNIGRSGQENGSDTCKQDVPAASKECDQKIPAAPVVSDQKTPAASIGENSIGSKKEISSPTQKRWKELEETIQEETLLGNLKKDDLPSSHPMNEGEASGAPTEDLAGAANLDREDDDEADDNVEEQDDDEDDDDDNLDDDEEEEEEEDEEYEEEDDDGDDNDKKEERAEETVTDKAEGSFDAPSSKVFDLETRLSPTENGKPSVNPGSGILNGIARFCSPLVGLRTSSNQND